MPAKISFKAVIIGAIIGVACVNLLHFFVGLFVFFHYHLTTLPRQEIISRLNLLTSDYSTIGAILIILGFSCTVLSGYIAARFARHDELLNAALASFLCVFIDLLSLNSTPIFYVVVGVLLNPVLALGGGYIYQRQKITLARALR
jgi:hypothetical protein